MTCKAAEMKGGEYVQRIIGSLQMERKIMKTESLKRGAR